MSPNSQTPEPGPEPAPDPANTVPGKMGLRVVLFVAALLGVTTGGLAIFLNTENANIAQTEETACSFSDERRTALNAAAQGDVAAFAVLDEPRPVPMLAFNDGDEQAHAIADWRGKSVLFNLWATWCAPCREEMPMLDALQRDHGDEDFEVVAVSIDTRESADPLGFLQEIDVEALTFYQDKSASLFNDLRAEGLAFGMPTTLLIDDEGCLQGWLAGPAHWDGADAVALIEAASIP